MEARVIDWDGTNVPTALQSLPPGRYVVYAWDECSDLSPEEDAAVQEGIDDAEAGHVFSLEDIVRDLRARLNRA